MTIPALLTTSLPIEVQSWLSAVVEVVLVLSPVVVVAALSLVGAALALALACFASATGCSLLCIRPYKPSGATGPEFDCGKCMPCRIDARRVWTTRICLELRMHHASSFVTLTYATDPGTLIPADLRNFFKRLRKLVPPKTVRYFACGEYGDQTARPHYHIALFGLDPVQAEELCKMAWALENIPLGFVQVGELNEHSAAYIAGYVSKKISQRATRSDVVHPEFRRMSNRPGIGAGAAAVMGAQLTQSSGAARALSLRNDVPYTVHMDGKHMPIGKYLTGQLRVHCGWSKGCPEAVKTQMQIESQSMTVEERAALEARRVHHYNSANSRAAILLTKANI